MREVAGLLHQIDSAAASMRWRPQDLAQEVHRRVENASRDLRNQENRSASLLRFMLALALAANANRIFGGVVELGELDVLLRRLLNGQSSW